MHFSTTTSLLTVLSVFSSLSSPAAAQLQPQTVTVAYNDPYDAKTFDLATTSCSDGDNGLVTRGYKTAGDLPTFPNIGAVFTVQWNSPNCGGCYSLSYKGGPEVVFTAIDVAQEGASVSKALMNTLTNGRAEEIGRADMEIKSVDASLCGI